MEEEYQTTDPQIHRSTDPETRDLRSHIAAEMLAQGSKNASKRRCPSPSSPENAIP